MAKDNFASRLRRARKMRFSSQKAFAETCGFQAETYRMWERGAREPNLKTLAKISVTLGVSLDELVVGYKSQAATGQRWRWETDIHNQIRTINFVTRLEASLNVASSIPWPTVNEMMTRRERVTDLTCHLLIDSRLVVIEVSGGPVFDRDGQYEGYRGVGREVVGRERDLYLQNRIVKL